MNVQQYHKLIQDPCLLNKDTLKDIEDLVKNFPMVENFRILLALNLLILDDYRYDDALTNAAIYSSDRKRLKEWVDYILKSLSDDEEKYDVESLEVEPDDKENVNTQKETIEKESEEEIPGISESTELIPGKDAQTHSIAEKEISEPIEELKPKKPLEETDTKDIEDVEAEKKNIRSKKELLKLVRKRLNEIEAEKTRKEEVKNKEDDDLAVKTQLIDRFIEQEPSISRPDKNEFFDPQNEAAESTIDEDDFFVTETLAQIHTQQGNLRKAEEIYRKLILKNPEKSSYFAAQIEKLTKK